MASLLHKIHYAFLKTYFSVNELAKIREPDLKVSPEDYVKNPDSVRNIFSPQQPSDFCITESLSINLKYLLEKPLPPHKVGAIFAKFLGWPWLGGWAPKEEKIPARVGKFLWFVATFAPRLILNVAKLLTEIAPSIIVAVTGSIIDQLKILKNTPAQSIVSIHKEEEGISALINLPSIQAKAKNVFLSALQGLLYLIYIPALLAYFTGRAITSPMRNARESWQMFSSWRKEGARLRQAAGYLFGGAAFLLSTAITATAYFFLWPYALVAGKAVGIGALAAKIAAISKWGIGSWISAKAAVVSQFMSQTILANMSLGMTAAGNYLAAQAVLQPLAAAFYFVAQQPLALFVAATMSSTPIVGNILRPALRATGAKLRPLAKRIGHKIDDSIDNILEACRSSTQPPSEEKKDEVKPNPPKEKGWNCLNILRKMCGGCMKGIINTKTESDSKTEESSTETEEESSSEESSSENSSKNESENENGRETPSLTRSQEE